MDSCFRRNDIFRGNLNFWLFVHWLLELIWRLGLGGGVETTVLDMAKSLLIPGMIIQGDPRGSHYGTVSIGKPNASARKECKKLGEKFTRLVKRLGAAS